MTVQSRVSAPAAKDVSFATRRASVRWVSPWQWESALAMFAIVAAVVAFWQRDVPFISLQGARSGRLAGADGSSSLSLGQRLPDGVSMRIGSATAWGLAHAAAGCLWGLASGCPEVCGTSVADRRSRKTRSSLRPAGT